MSRINPNGSKCRKTYRHNWIWSIKVIKDFAQRKKDVADVVSPEYGNTNPSEMEAIGKEDEWEGGDVVKY